MDQRLWDNLLDVGRMDRYYMAIADKNRLIHLILTLMTILGAVWAAAMLFMDLDPLLNAVPFVLVVIGTTSMAVFDFSKESQVAFSAGEQLREIEGELRRLWHNRHNLSAAMEAEVALLERRIISATTDQVRYNKRLNLESSQEAMKVAEDFYGPEPRAAKGSAETANT